MAMTDHGLALQGWGGGLILLDVGGEGTHATELRRAVWICAAGEGCPG